MSSINCSFTVFNDIVMSNQCAVMWSGCDLLKWLNSAVIFVALVQLDMKYLSPLMLAYEDRLSEKDALLQSVQVSVQVSVCVFFSMCEDLFVRPVKVSYDVSLRQARDMSLIYPKNVLVLEKNVLDENCLAKLRGERTQCSDICSIRCLPAVQPG